MGATVLATPGPRSGSDGSELGTEIQGLGFAVLGFGLGVKRFGFRARGKAPTYVEYFGLHRGAASSERGQHLIKPFRGHENPVQQRILSSRKLGKPTPLARKCRIVFDAGQAAPAACSSGHPSLGRLVFRSKVG